MSGESLERALSEATDNRLSSARDELQRLQAILAAAATIARQTGGPAAGAVVQVTDALEQPRQQAAMLLGWLAFGQMPQVETGLQEILSHEAEAQAAQESFLHLQQLREGVPALAQVLAPKRIGAAQRSPTRMARLQAELRETAEEYRAEIDTFLDKHPDIRDGLDAGTATELRTRETPRRARHGARGRHTGKEPACPANVPNPHRPLEP